MVKIDTSKLKAGQFDFDSVWETLFKWNGFLNSEFFREHYLDSLAIHEAGHAAVLISLGATHTFKPASIRWDDKRNAPSLWWAYVSFPRSSLPTELVPRLKIWLAGRAAQRKLAPNPAIDEIQSPAIEIALAKSDYLENGGEEKNFEADKAAAESELSELLEIPAFCERVEMLADDFKNQIFPPPPSSVGCARNHERFWDSHPELA